MTSKEEAVPAERPAGSPRQTRRGPAPFASFDHDVAEETSPESKLKQLPEIREHTTNMAEGGGSAAEAETAGGLEVPEGRARSASSPGVQLPAPRIDISRASSSSHHDSHDSSPDMAFPSELAFREEGALDLRSSTEELPYLEGESDAKQKTPVSSHPISVTAPCSRRHSRKDSQGSEVQVMLNVCGRTSRLSSVGSQCSGVSRISGVSRSPSPHRMLLETSFCGPRPIDNDPDTCERKLIEMARLSSERRESAPVPLSIAEVIVSAPIVPAQQEPSSTVSTATRVQPTLPHTTPTVVVDEIKLQKETKNKAVAQQNRTKTKRTGDIIRIKLKPDDEYDDDDDDSGDAEEIKTQTISKPATLNIRSRDQPPARTPSPASGTPYRKTSFTTLFKSSPESPGSGSRRKKSVSDGRRSTSSSRERPPSGLRGSVLSLFRSNRKSSMSPPPPPALKVSPLPPTSQKVSPAPSERLKYYEETSDGIIHIPLHSPPNEPNITSASTTKIVSAPTSRPASATSQMTPLQRTVLPDGSIIIPLHSPTEKTIDPDAIEMSLSPDGDEIVREHYHELRTSAIRNTDAPIVQMIESPIVYGKETEVKATIENCEPKRSKITKQHVVFSTNMGETDQMFSTQLSVTKTPSLTSEVSVEAPLPLDTEPVRADIISEASLPQSNKSSARTSIASTPRSEGSTPRDVKSNKFFSKTEESSDKALSKNDRKDRKHRSADVASSSNNLKLDKKTPDKSPSTSGTKLRGDSTESEGSSDAASARRDGEDVEKRGLVLGQESFEDELPYVPTTLPLERPLGVPIVPVRERGDVHVAPVQRPRPPTTTSASRPQSVHVSTYVGMISSTEKLRIIIPSRPRSDSRQRHPTMRAEWIDFEDVPERRKQPKRIQTLPPGVTTPGDPPAADDGVIYVQPDQCRCECHHLTPRDSSSSAECDGDECVGGSEVPTLELSVHIGRPFNTDLDMQADHSAATSPEQRGRNF